MIEKLYTVEEVAELASVTGRTIRNYLKSGRLVGRKIGGQWRFPESEVQRLLTGAGYEEPEQTPAAKVQPVQPVQPAQPQPQINNINPSTPPPVNLSSSNNINMQPPANLNVTENIPHNKAYSIENETSVIKDNTSYNNALNSNEKYLHEEINYFQNQINQPSPQTQPVPQVEKQQIQDFPVDSEPYEDNSFEHGFQHEHENYYNNKIAPLPNNYPPPPPQSQNHNAAMHTTGAHTHKNLASLPKRQFPKNATAANNNFQENYFQNNIKPHSYENNNIKPESANADNYQPPIVNNSMVENQTQNHLFSEPSEPIEEQINNMPVPPQNQINIPQPTLTNAQQPTNINVEKENFIDSLSEVGIKAAEFSSHIHIGESFGECCSVFDIQQNLAKAKSNMDNLQILVERERKNNLNCDVYLEYDERYSISRYTVFGNINFIEKCINIIK